jgi:hypothetical protein
MFLGFGGNGAHNCPGNFGIACAAAAHLPQIQPMPVMKAKFEMAFRGYMTMGCRHARSAKGRISDSFTPAITTQLSFVLMP